MRRIPWLEGTAGSVIASIIMAMICRTRHQYAEMALARAGRRLPGEDGSELEFTSSMIPLQS